MEPEAVSDARRWGAGAEEIAAIARALGGCGEVRVWPQNRAALDAFLAAATQWRTAIGLRDGRLATLWVGLDYAGVRVALASRGIALDRQTMSGLHVLELAAREAMNGEAG